MNSFRNLTIRTKKSLSGLLLGYGDEGSVSPKAAENTMPTSPTTPTENDSVGLEEFGAVGRDSFSSSKDSPSKRHGLLGTLRTIGSMRSFKSANVKSDDYTAPLSTAYVHLEATATKHERPSLTLTVENSPFHCLSGTEIDDIRHRVTALSIAEPVQGSIFDAKGPSAFTVGSIMDSPAPIKKMLDREESFCSRPVSPISMLPMSEGEVPTPSVFSPMAGCPVPTPMPGTNLPMDGDAGLAAADILSARGQDELPSYFDLVPMIAGQQDTECTNNDNIANDYTARDHGSDFMVKPTEKDMLQPHASQSTIDRNSMPELPLSHTSRAIVVPKSKPHDAKEAMVPAMDSDSLTPADLSRKSLQAKKDKIYAYLACEKRSPKSNDEKRYLERRMSAWSRHTGLYDGTGYGDREATVQDTTITAPPPEFHISDEDTIHFARHIMFDDSVERKPEADNEEFLLLGGPNKPWAKCTDEGAALDDLIRTYGDHWHEVGHSEAHAIQFMRHSPEKAVMACDEMTEVERKVEETELIKMVTGEPTEEMKSELAESFRQTNESLGG